MVTRCTHRRLEDQWSRMTKITFSDATCGERAIEILDVLRQLCTCLPEDEDGAAEDILYWAIGHLKRAGLVLPLGYDNVWRENHPESGSVAQCYQKWFREEGGR